MSLISHAQVACFWHLSVRIVLSLQRPLTKFVPWGTSQTVRQISILYSITKEQSVINTTHEVCSENFLMNTYVFIPNRVN